MSEFDNKMDKHFNGSVWSNLVLSGRLSELQIKLKILFRYCRPYQNVANMKDLRRIWRHQILNARKSFNVSVRWIMVELSFRSCPFTSYLHHLDDSHISLRERRRGNLSDLQVWSANSWQTESLDVHSDNSIIRPSENIYLKYVVDQIPRFSLSRILKAIVAELGQHLGEYYRQHRDCGHKSPTAHNSGRHPAPRHSLGGLDTK